MQARIETLEAELVAAREREAATAEVLQVINSSSGNLSPVFDAILDKAHSLWGIAFSCLQLYEDGKFRAGAVRGVPGPLADILRQPFEFPTGSPPSRLLGGEPFVQVADMAEVAEQQLDDPRAQATAEHGLHTVLFVPLRRDANFLGYIAVFRQEVRPFFDREIALLQNFAAQAVIAMENARLLTETREALEQQTATAEVLGVINSSPADLAPVFEAMVGKAMRLCQGTFGHLYTYDGERFHPVAAEAEPDFAEWWRQFGPVRPMNNDAPLGRLVQGERVVRIEDARQERGYGTVPGFREMVDKSGIRSGLTVALDKEGMLRGAITVYRKEVRPFSEQQLALLENFAAQGVIAMENARLITETREALEQQTATAEVLQVINASPGNLEPVFDAMLDKAIALSGASFGGLSTYDGQQFRAVATRGIPPELSDFYSKPFTPGPESYHGRLVEGESVLHIEDLAAEHSSASRSPLTEPGIGAGRALVELGGARTALLFALRRDEALLGSFWFYRREVRPFSEKQIALVRNFAAQAVIAMENARLLTETREALEQQTATAEVLQVINSWPGDLAPVFDSILEKALYFCEAAFGFLWTWDGERMHRLAFRGVPAELVESLRQPTKPAPGSIPERIIGGEIVVSEADAREGGPNRLRTLARLGARSYVGVALRKDEKLLGGITIYRRQVRPFSEKQIALLQNFAAQAVIAMENARLITETHEALEQQTATAEVLGVINASPGDVEPVFDAILEKAHTLCGATLGSLRIYDGEYVRAVAVRGQDESFANELKQGFPAGPLLASLLAGGSFVHVPDALQIDHPVARRSAEKSGTRTLLIVPLRKDESLLGMIFAGRQEVSPFTDKQIALLQNFAAQAVIAMENARLLGELRQRTEEVAELNRGLEARVAEQVEELGRVGRLKRFLAPQLAELIVSQGDEKILESHRREIVVVFCDLRGYTAFTETAEPEEVLDFLRDYHGALGPLVSQFEGTLDQFSGDGIMVFFNDPVPVPDPAERAVNMAVSMREAASTLITAWRRRDRDLGFGVGIAQGYATLGQIGFAERSGYTAIGTVCNLAARLCAKAKDGQILISGRVAAAIEKVVPLENLGGLKLKGLTQPVSAFNVSLGASQRDLRVIEGGAQST